MSRLESVKEISNEDYLKLNNPVIDSANRFNELYLKQLFFNINN